MRISDWSSDVCSSDLGRWVTLSGRGPVRGRQLVRYVPDTPGGLRSSGWWVSPSSSRRARVRRDLGGGRRVGGVGCRGAALCGGARGTGRGGAGDRCERKRVVWGKSVSVRVNLR